MRGRITWMARLCKDAEILDGADYLARYHPTGCIEPERVGDLVVIAGASAFPGAMPDAAYEHGGISRDEMISLLGWLDRHPGGATP